MPLRVRGDEFNKLYSALIDRNGNLWVGAQNSGLWCCRLTGKMGIFHLRGVGTFACISSRLPTILRALRWRSCVPLFWTDGAIGPSEVHSAMSPPFSVMASMTIPGLPPRCDSVQFYHPSSGRFSVLPFPGLGPPSSIFSKVQRMLTGELWLLRGDGIFIAGCGGRWTLPVHHKGVWSRPGCVGLFCG